MRCTVITCALKSGERLVPFSSLFLSHCKTESYNVPIRHILPISIISFATLLMIKKNVLRRKIFEHSLYLEISLKGKKTIQIMHAGKRA